MFERAIVVNRALKSEEIGVRQNLRIWKASIRRHTWTCCRRNAYITRAQEPNTKNHGTTYTTALEVVVVSHRVVHVLRLGRLFSLEPISQLESLVHILRMILRRPARMRVSGGERRHWSSARP